MKPRTSRLVICLLPALLALAFVGVRTMKADDRDKASVWMTKKLEYSQKILAGLTKEDFEMISTNADAMTVVTYLENWDRAGRADYRKQLRVFETANKDLVRHAKAKNLAAATRSYTQLIQSCVECHTVIRDARK
ncbi:MAG: hypothetical protein ACKO23_18455 [Gemmataceae bacterium]